MNIMTGKPFASAGVQMLSARQSSEGGPAIMYSVTTEFQTVGIFETYCGQEGGYLVAS